MSPPTSSTDKTNFVQGLMHMIKGNLGTGILAMPMTFKQCGLATGSIVLPLLCLMATFCVHLLVRCSQHLENKMKWTNLDYASLSKGAFKAGPKSLRAWSGFMSRIVDGVLIISQVGICCVYLVFMVDNIKKIITLVPAKSDFDHSDDASKASMHRDHLMMTNLSAIDTTTPVEKNPANHVAVLNNNAIFLCLVPFVLLISYIRTLRRLSIASACANVLQSVGISIILMNLIKAMPSHANTENFTSLPKAALGFGSAMFAFEGISVVLPIYTRMKKPEQMGGVFGLINVSYVILLILYSAVGIMGYLVFGDKVEGSITLNLPNDDFSHVIQAAFTVSIFLTYPLQFYVPNEIIWNYVKSRIFSASKEGENVNSKLEYAFRSLLVMITFILAITIPQLNLLMGLVGSISGTALSITLPAIIHLATFWDDVSGSSKAVMIIMDSILIIVSIIAGFSGSVSSLVEIYESF